MKCCPLWNGTAITDHHNPLGPHFLSVSQNRSGVIWSERLRRNNLCESRWNRLQTSPKGKLLWKRGWLQEPQLPVEAALETLKFNKITNSGRGGRRRQNSMCCLDLAAWNPDLWTPLNHISFSLLGPAAFTQCGERVETNLFQLNYVWAFTSAYACSTAHELGDKIPRS